jgi:hypothetical protein
MKPYTGFKKVLFDLVSVKNEVEKPSIDFVKLEDGYDIHIDKMYEAVQLNWETMNLVARSFETNHIDLDSYCLRGGCDSCDYGSSYRVTLNVRNHKRVPDGVE